ncbi:MAG: NADH-quinone oxidoreductase subunit NuoG [Rhodocyclaceae bacterium]|nr:NADH-quinone oxidoreductase subunit NuoG [Rhodocyclaceae bacterium]
MLNIEIDGKPIQVEPGTTIIQAAKKLGVHIPHFCYHKKLSIAASCRMCLVEVEQGGKPFPKPLPACATTTAEGMKVFTHSDLAIKAQQGVMEFLLINHPLDCPICDQAGECKLQDIAMGYGNTVSRFHEEKRVVESKELGPLIASDASRCINCTRCVRFLQEISGFQEMGQAFRGDRAEIMPFIGQAITSELSGNLIDICPVGSLTSKPARNTVRSWELARRLSVAPHDGLGSRLYIHVKNNRVYRVTPRHTEAINSCWISDKDRFSYTGLYAADRLTKPMLKQGGVWQEVSWNQALDYAAHTLRDIAQQDASALGALISPTATLEEMSLAGQLMRGLGSENIDHRLRQRDFSPSSAPWLGMKITDLPTLDRVLLVGSNLRSEHPLIALRLRQAVNRGGEVHLIDNDLLIRLAAIVKAVATLKNAPCELKCIVSEEAKRVADNLVIGQNIAVLLGNVAQHHPKAATLHTLAQQLASLLNAKVGCLSESANTVGGYVARALPSKNGLNADRMLREPRQAYLLLGCEPEQDCAEGALALSAMKQAQSVIVLSPFASAATYADCLLPIAPFTETSGTFINMEGRVQSFAAAVRPLGEARPGWKVLAALGKLLDLPDFDVESSEEVKNNLLPNTPEFVTLEDSLSDLPVDLTSDLLADALVPVAPYATDALVRRATCLQQPRNGGNA